ncbi:MAG: hypothetical protein O9353_04745, partial [Bacteroidia bacterium]|nr:hypothetical protein [Bacteroidia bacterium]
QAFDLWQQRLVFFFFASTRYQEVFRHGVIIKLKCIILYTKIEVYKKIKAHPYDIYSFGF